MEKLPTVFSYGGGVQSVAICCLILNGKLRRPDYIVIADTEFERSSTWDYMNKYTQTAMSAFGLPIRRVKRSDFTKHDYLYRSGNGNTHCMLPVFNKTESGSPSKASGYCSDQMKKKVFESYLKSIEVVKYITWLGYSADEMRRAKPRPNIEYPLIGGLFGGSNLVMTRQNCLEEIGRMGWPIPHKSSCYICPNMTDAEWRSIPANELEAAAMIEMEIRTIDDGHDKYLHRSCRPLDTVDFNDNSGQIELPGCDSGMCFV